MFLTRCRFRRRTDYNLSYSTVRTGWRSIRTLQAGGLPYGQVGGLSVRYRLEVPYGQVVLLEASLTHCTTEIFVLVLSVSRTAKYLLATGTPEEISLPEERRTFRTDSSHTPLTDD